MRKILGNFGTIARPFLRAIILLPLFIPAMCHAQWSCPTWPTISSVTPSTWVAGQTYKQVVITGSGFKGPTKSCNEFFFRVTLTNGGNVTLSDVSTVSDSKMTATVTVPSSDTAQTACVTVEYQWWDVIRKTASGNSGACPPPYSNGNGTVVPFAVPILCSIPSVTSVTPDGWWATGQPQDITIAGSCFLGSSDRGGPTKVAVTDAAGAVKLSNINVVSATQITASVNVSKKAPADPAEAATLTVTNPTSDGTPQSATANPAPVVLPVPVIKWKNKTISGDNPQIKNPKVVVGQPVELTTIPASLPGGFTISNSTWVVPGNDIKSYNGDDSGITIDDNVDLQDVATTFYWLYPEPDLSVTYNYCATDPNGNQICTSPQAKAAFTAKGPDSSNALATWDSDEATIEHLTNCTTNGTAPYMGYGDLSGPIPDCPGLQSGTPGIKLTASGASEGRYVFVQLIDSDSRTYTSPTGSYTCTRIPNLDKQFPYPPYKDAPNIAPDGPEIPLPPEYLSGQRDFLATMYLLWQPDQLRGATQPSIPVPIGHQQWRFKATTDQKPPIGKEKWEKPTLMEHGVTDGYVPSQATDNQLYGYPVFNAPSIEVCP